MRAVVSVMCSGLNLVLAGACAAQNPRERRIVSSSWDTLFQVGSVAADDTVLLEPFHLQLWNDRIIVIDLAPKISVFAKSGGQLLWQYSRKGAGPGEFDAPYDAVVAPNGNVWVLDPAPARMLEFTPQGQVKATHSLQHLRVIPAGVIRTGDRTHFLAVSGGVLSIIETAGLDFRVIAQRPFPWPDSIPVRRRRHLFALGADHEQKNTRVVAFTYGPGFVVWLNERSSPYRYIDSIPFDPAIAMPPGPGGGPVLMRQDTVRWGAHQITIVNDEIFMLFGGRPQTVDQKSEPIQLVDVYSTDGRYRRSYRLPYPVSGLTTDGTTFFALRSDPYPMLQALRPK